MRHSYLLFGLLSLVAVSCSMTEIDVPDRTSTEKSYYIVVDDQPDGERTRTFVNEELSVVWNHDDRFTLFDNFVLGDEWVFTGDDGASAGEIKPVSTESHYYVGVDDLGGFKYAVYPHRTTTEITTDGILTYFFPDKQYYEANSFGRDANVMVSKTSDNKFRFKNVGGYLAFQLYGDDVSVSSLTLEGNHAELLAGKSSISISEGLPVVTMSQDNSATSSVELYCKEPVQLSSSSTEPTVFWFVLPTVTFSEGFKLTVKTSDDKVFQATTQRDLQIERNIFKSMAAIKVTPQTPTSGESVSLNGASIVSVNNWDPSKNNPYTAKFDDQDERTFIITVPTVTDFSHLVLHYDFTGSVLVADGQEVENGVTAVDASKPVSLMVRNGNREKRYTLKARNTGLPVVRITTEGFSLADIEGDPVHKTLWRPNPDDQENPKPGSASMVIEMPDGTIDCQTDIQIKGRGNATWGYPKRPYALKFPDGKKVLGMPSHKRWVLLANWKDRTLLRNDAAFWLSRQVSDVIEKERESSSFPYTVKGKFVELEINGQHRGNYYLCEQIKINKTKRVPITEMAKLETGASNSLAITGGYLMEIDNNWDDDNSFYSGDYPGATSNNGFKFKYQFKEPDEKDRSQEAYAYMTQHIAMVESLIKRIPKTQYSQEQRQEYRKYIDVESAIWFMIINELTSNGDFYNENYSDTYKGPHSTYLYKDRDVQNEDGTTTVSKIHMGPVWDFDYLTFMPSRSNKWAGADQKNYYYNYFYADEDFKTEMYQLWNQYNSYFSGLGDYIDLKKKEISLSAEFDGDMWWNTTAHGHKDQDQNGELNMTFDQAVENIKSGYSGKWTFINNNIGKLKYQNPSSIWGW